MTPKEAEAHLCRFLLASVGLYLDDEITNGPKGPRSKEDQETLRKAWKKLRNELAKRGDK